MTTLYRPVLIESAEQAEALPDGTVATRDGHLPRILLRDETGQHWASGDAMSGFMYALDMRGWSALVPIEAEEETWEPGNPAGSRIRAPQPPHAAARRLVTPWEEA